jgi:hypothetical protein
MAVVSTNFLRTMFRGRSAYVMKTLASRELQDTKHKDL